MNLKRVIGSHAERWECNRLFAMGRLIAALSTVCPMAEVGRAARLK